MSANKPTQTIHVNQVTTSEDINFAFYTPSKLTNYVTSSSAKKSYPCFGRYIFESQSREGLLSSGQILLFLSPSSKQVG